MTEGREDAETRRIISPCLRVALSRRSFFIFTIFTLCFFCLQTSFAQNPENLAEAVRSGTTEVKRDALLRIRNLQTVEASRLALPALADSSEIVRATAAFSVIYLPPAEAARALLPLLEDKSELVRREAAYALGKVRFILSEPSVLNSLLQVLQKDKMPAVRNAAIVALGEIGDPRAVDTLTNLLRQKPDKADEFTRRSAARSIGQIADFASAIIRLSVILQARPTLDARAAETPKETLIERFPQFRAAVGVLIQIMQNPKESPDAKREAAFALGAIGDQQALPVLQANANDADYFLAEISRKALSKIQNR